MTWCCLLLGVKGMAYVATEKIAWPPGSATSKCPSWHVHQQVHHGMYINRSAGVQVDKFFPFLQAAETASCQAIASLLPF